MSGSSQTGVTESIFIVMLFEAQASRCFCCDEPMVRGESAKRYGKMGWSREHVYPRGGAGHGLQNNIVLSHPMCNGDRGGREPTGDEVSKARAIYSAMGLVPFVRIKGDVRRARKAMARYADPDWPPRIGDAVAS